MFNSEVCMKIVNSPKFIVFAAFAALFGLMPLSPAMAADLTPPELQIEEASNKLKVKMQDPGFTKDFKQITEFVEQTIYPHVDFDRISALVLGKNWKNANEEEKKQFTREFQTLLVRTYSRAFIEFKDWSVKFLPLSKDENPSKVVVNTEVLQPGKKPIAVNYRMLESNGEWKAYDITIEGVSLVTNYRSSFKTEIEKTGSLASVIESLVKRNKEALAKDPLAKEAS
jgi:phospholipid transport system substrate-binding protein